MTLEIADGRGELFQWDTGRIIEFGEDAVSQAHFTSSEKVINIPYTVEVKNRKAAIPDELLQVPGKLIVYAWVSDTNGGYTKVQVNFPVFARPKPSDYVYTPTEHAGFDRLRTEIGDLSALQTDAKDNLVAAINEASASGVQPDWNQNDATQPDYVKNRPLYTGGPVETTFVEDSTVSFTRNEHSGFYLGSLQSAFVATVGETYKVSWDGTTYECTCVDSNGKTIIGNLSMLPGTAGPDTGEPFTMMVYNRVGIEIATADTSASHTFSISGFAQEVVKIDRKYLPKAAFITYDSSTSTYNSDLTNDELYEIMLNGEQVVFYNQSEKSYYYLKHWRIHLSGRIDLSFDGKEFAITLFTDGTIGKTPNE